MRKPRSLPKYVSEFADRHGKMRVRFRRKGQEDYYFRALPWTQEFMLEYRSCLDKRTAPQVIPGIRRSKAGTFDDLISSYYQSVKYNRCAESTRRNYRNILDRFREKHGDKPVALMEKKHVERIIGRMNKTPEAANSLLRRLKMLFNYAIDNGVQFYKAKGNGYHSWTEHEIEAFTQRHPVGSKPWLAMALMLYTGQRRSDAIRIGWRHIYNNKINITQKKTNASLILPIHPDLESVISELPYGDVALLKTAQGRPFTPAGFGNWFRKRCNEAGLRHCTAHGLRKAASRRLAYAGCSNPEFKSITGHKSDKEVNLYIEDAVKDRLAEQAMAKTYGMKEPAGIV